MKTALHLLPLLLALLPLACHRSANPPRHPAALTAQQRYEQALAALDSDSVRAGERLLHQAIRQAEHDGDLHTRYLAELRLAESLSWGNTEAALSMARQALETFQRQPDNERNHVIILDNIGTYASQLAYNTDAPFTEALDATRRAHALAEAIRDTELISQTLTSLANIHWAMDEGAEALRCARQAEALAPPNLALGAQQVLARCLFSADSLQAAEDVYRAMQTGDDLQAAYIVQSNLAKLALRRHDLDAAEAGIDEAFERAEELYFSALSQKADYYEAALAQQRENEHLRYAAALHRRTLWAAVAFFLLVAAVAAVTVRSRLRNLHAQRLAAAWRRKHDLDQQLHLRRMTAQHAHHLQQQLRMREATVDFLKDFILTRSAAIQKLTASADRHITLLTRDWADIERTLNAIDSDRFVRLRQQHPELKEEDIQLCILTRLRITNRAIGNIYGVSISAVQHRKLKLKKDVFGQPDPEVTLEQVLDTV